VETALVIVLDDAEPFDAVRREIAAGTVARGIPFHITLLSPFAPREELTDTLLAETRTFFAGRVPFTFELTRIAAWPRVVYAVPEPAAELRDCMQALFARYPQWPPYGGMHADVVPHATLAEEVKAAALLAEIERRLRDELPRRYTAEEATLLEEYAPGRWRERERFRFGA
jgi:2'-5' RNA ligase